MPRREPGSPHSIDVHVGQRLRALRRQGHVSQEALAWDVGVSFQQLQKYEAGANRISASKLYLLARSLRCSIADFYDGLPPTHPKGLAADPRRAEVDQLLGRRCGQEILDGLAALPDGLLPLVSQLIAVLADPTKEAARQDAGLASAA